MPTSNPRTILGIDPGLADTGFGVIVERGTTLSALACGSIKTAAGTPAAERLRRIHHDVTALIKKYRPNVVAVEQLFFCKNVKTALAVGQARGVVILAAGQRGIPIREFTPLQIKLALSGYGKAGKRQVQQMVKAVLKLSTLPQPDDAADALAAAICCAHQGRYPTEKLIAVS